MNSLTPHPSTTGDAYRAARLTKAHTLADALHEYKNCPECGGILTTPDHTHTQVPVSAENHHAHVGFLACSAEQPVDVQIRAGGSWITRKSDTTNSNGKFSVLIRDIAAKYRAVAPKTALAPFPPVLDLCLRAVSNVRRHRHG